MNRAHLGGSKDRRVADSEKRACALMGTTRNKWRKRYEKKADALPIRAHTGDAIQIDAKSKRSKMPKWICEDLARCQSYSPAAIPCLMVYWVGNKPIAILPAEALARLAGIQAPAPGEQLGLARST